jgi:hypothetical protein
MKLAWVLLVGMGLMAADGRTVSYGFTAGNYVIEMSVRYPPAYEGKPLVVEAGPICFENFVGALAVVEFRVMQVTDRKPASGLLRELVTVTDQSSGLPERPPFGMAITLRDGVGSDIQAFGYDESLLPPTARPAEREAAKTAWRRYRQELYLAEARQPFAVIEWQHTNTRIRILSVSSPAGH